jgi:hypothetical protein
LAELLDCGAEIALAVADVGTQGEIDGLLHGFILAGEALRGSGAADSPVDRLRSRPARGRRLS